MVTEMLLLSITIIVILYIFNWVRLLRGLPPGPPHFPLIGSLLSMNKGSLPVYKVLTDLARKYGDVLTIYFPTGKGAVPYVVINSFEQAYDAMVTQKDAFSGRPGTFTSKVLSRGGDGLVFSDFDCKTALTRKIVHKALRLYNPNLESKIIEEAEDIATRFANQGEQPFDSKRILDLAIVNVIFAIVYNKRFDLDDPQFLAFIRGNDKAIKVLSPFNILNFFPWLIHFPIPSSRLLSDVMKNRDMRERWYFNVKETFQEHDIRHLADALLQARSEEEKEDEFSSANITLNDKDLLATINNIFGAGSETTSTALRWLIAYLLNHPEIQENLYSEIKEEFSETGKINLKARQKCHLLEATLTEVLRHSSVAPVFIHKTTCNTTLSGYNLPKDTVVLLNIWAINHDERQWKNPEEFNPNRFLDSEGHFTGTRKMSYMPFGAGRRVCIGESLAKTELFLISATLLQKFKFEAPEGSPPPDINDGILSLTFAPKPFQVVAKLR